MEQTTTTLTNAIAELTAQVEQLTAKNLELQKTVESLNSSEVNDGIIGTIIKAIPREVILEVWGEDGFSLEDVEYISKNYGVEEIFSKRQIIEYVKDNCDMDDVYDSDDIVEWVKDNRSMCDVYDVDCVTEWSLDDVLMEFGEDEVMQEVANQGWSKQSDVSDIISTLEDVIEQLKA